jgi:hypothetical protein
LGSLLVLAGLITNIYKDYRIGSYIKIVKELIKLARKKLK